MTFTFANGKWTKDGKEVSAAEVRAATKKTTTGYSGSFLPDPATEGYGPLPNDPEAKAAEMSQRVLESGYHGSVDNVPLWHPGERKLYSVMGPNGRSWAEEIEIEDDLKHAGDY